MKEIEIKRINEELIKLGEKLRERREDYMKSVNSIKQIKDKIWEEKMKLSKLTSKENSVSNQIISNKDLIDLNIKKMEKGEELTEPLAQLNDLSRLEYGVSFFELIKTRREKEKMESKPSPKVKESEVLGELDLSWIKDLAK